MKIGMVGLGRMGMNMARRLIQGGHEVVAYNRSPDKIDELAREGGIGSASLADLVGKLEGRRVVWLMLPAGRTVDDHVEQLRELLDPEDIIIEGGNSFYKDDIRRADFLAGPGIHYVDAGVSGGIWGLEVGYCTMVGGRKADFEYLEPIFKTLAPENGYMYCGPVGAGHFVKMIHNGIEYGMMQAYGEGFAILEASPYGVEMDYSELAKLWNRGSVIRSWLLELLEDAFARDPELADLKGYVDDSGEGRWTVQQAVETGVSAPVITSALFRRFESRQPDAFENKVLAALRREFGGHAVKKA
ncbi:MAG: decarboxylating 6-phosphogluconate dehydrogenase [Proteobacteria bacterium]|nr:decarboxylating 6-phosphogluconate dehydrogenase [Pseudomonadota bacterium]MBU1737234.1 decarboxylating 6-phosphogluconate dehydrogenase [Pseudomonadota bacterium]